MNKAGDGIPPNQLDSLSDDLISLSRGGVIHKPGSNALGGGIIASYLSADGPKIIAMSGLGMMSKKLPSTQWETNTDVKHQLRKEI